MAKEHNVYVTIATSLAGMYIAIVAIIAVFDKAEAWVLVPIVFGFVLLGWLMAHYASKRR